MERIQIICFSLNWFNLILRINDEISLTIISMLPDFSYIQYLQIILYKIIRKFNRASGMARVLSPWEQIQFWCSHLSYSWNVLLSTLWLITLWITITDLVIISPKPKIKSQYLNCKTGPKWIRHHVDLHNLQMTLKFMSSSNVIFQCNS